MIKLALVAGGELQDLPETYEGYVGVDAGCLEVMKRQLSLVIAVGDFDSVSEQDYQRIADAAEVLIKAPAEKDDTDLELALIETFSRFPESFLTIYGATGGRLDHTLTNIFLPSHPKLAAYMHRFEVVDHQNLLAFYPAGRHQILPREGYTYVGFLLEGEGQLEIRGARYPLTADNYFARKLYASNEFMARPIEVIVPDGYLVAIFSKDR